jgi:hypothetical protein
MSGKKNNLKKVFTFLKPILRGAIKSLPFGNVVVEVGESIKESVENVKNDSAKPLTHNWLIYCSSNHWNGCDHLCILYKGNNHRAGVRVHWFQCVTIRRLQVRW